MPPEEQTGSEPDAAALLQRTTAELERGNVAEPGLKAETLLARALGCRRLELPLCRSRRVDRSAYAAFHHSVERLLRGEPLQYVLGDVEFMGHALAADPRALIPRPETEELVEAALACDALWSRPTVRVADVGTGSGCMAIGLALARPGAEIIATDCCADALALARENARKLGVEDRILFLLCDLLAELEDHSLHAVVSNPPYVRTADWLHLPREIRDFEPRAALDGGADGFCVISRLVPEAVRTLKSGGWLFMETAEDQARTVADRMARAGFHQVTVRKDLAGHDRIVRGQKK